jgi:hypothetical protein
MMVAVDTIAMAIGITIRHILTRAIAPILPRFAIAPAMLSLSDIAAAGRQRERPPVSLALSCDSVGSFTAVRASPPFEFAPVIQMPSRPGGYPDSRVNLLRQ